MNPWFKWIIYLIVTIGLSYYLYKVGSDKF